MVSKRRPKVHHARRPGIDRVRLKRGVSARQSGRKSKHRSIPLSQLSEPSYAARDRALHVLAEMRHNPALSLAHAAKLQGVKPGTVKKFFPSALKKADGKFRVTKTDRYTATQYIPDSHGNSVAVKTRSSKDRSALGQYLRDLGRYNRGDRNALTAWKGKEIAGVRLVTDARAIIAMEPALSDFSLYRAFQSGGA